MSESVITLHVIGILLGEEDEGGGGGKRRGESPAHRRSPDEEEGERRETRKIHVEATFNSQTVTTSAPGVRLNAFVPLVEWTEAKAFFFWRHDESTRPSRGSGEDNNNEEGDVETIRVGATSIGEADEKPLGFALIDVASKKGRERFGQLQIIPFNNNNSALVQTEEHPTSSDASLSLICVVDVTAERALVGPIPHISHHLQHIKKSFNQTLTIVGMTDFNARKARSGERRDEDEEEGTQDEDISVSFSSHDVELETRSWKPTTTTGNDNESFPQLTVETTLKISLYDLKTYLTISTLLFRIKGTRSGLLGLAALKLPSFEAGYLNHNNNSSNSSREEFHLFVEALTTGPVVWLNALGGRNKLSGGEKTRRERETRIAVSLQIVEESATGGVSSAGTTAGVNNSGSSSPLLGHSPSLPPSPLSPAAKYLSHTVASPTKAHGLLPPSAAGSTASPVSGGTSSSTAATTSANLHHAPPSRDVAAHQQQQSRVTGSLARRPGAAFTHTSSVRHDSTVPPMDPASLQIHSQILELVEGERRELRAKVRSLDEILKRAKDNEAACVSKLEELEKKERELIRKEEELARRARQREEDFKAAERKAKMAADFAIESERLKCERLTESLKVKEEDIRKLKAANARLEADNAALRDKFARTPGGKFESEYWRVVGEKTALEEQFLRYKEEMNVRLKAKEEEIQALSRRRVVSSWNRGIDFEGVKVNADAILKAKETLGRSAAHNRVALGTTSKGRRPVIGSSSTTTTTTATNAPSRPPESELDKLRRERFELLSLGRYKPEDRVIKMFDDRIHELLSRSGTVAP